MSGSRSRTGNGAPRSRQPFVPGLALLVALVEPAHPQTRTLEHQGVPRTYILANAGAEPRPAMIVLHGRRGADEPHRSSTSLDALAAREGFVAVYPAGISGVWNWPTRQASAEIPLSKAGSAPADDLGFLTRLTEHLIAGRIADPARIYVSGASMGGFMTFGLMCARSERIAAAAALIATMTERQVEECKPARAVPLVMLNGTLDRLVPWDGRKSGSGALLPVLETLRLWTELHHCEGLSGSRVSRTEPAASTGGILTVRIDGTDCRLEGALRFYRVEGGGHTLPSLRPQSDAEASRFGPRSTELETSEEVWAFLKRFKLP